MAVLRSAFCNLKAGIGHEKSGVLRSQRDQDDAHSKQIPSEDFYDNGSVRT